MIETYIIVFVASLMGGIGWSLSGYLVQYRKNHNSPDWKGFDTAKMRNDIILGVVLGIGVSIGNFAGLIQIPEITTLETFLQAFPAIFTALVLVDKFIVNGAFGREQA